MANKELENAISVLKSNKTIQKLYLKFLDEFMKPNEDKSLTSSPATTAAVIVDGESPGEDNIRFLMPLKDFNTEKTTDEIIAMNAYVLGMTNFSLACVLNIVSILMVLCTGMARHSSGIYFIVLLMADLIYIIFRTVLLYFYFPWIDVDVFDMVDNQRALCQTWVVITESMMYWRQWLLVALVIDRCISIQCRGSYSILWKICGIFLLASLAINVGAAVYWAKIVDDRIGFDPYTPKTCALPKSDPNDTTSEHFWMEAMVHLAYPDAVMNIVLLLAALVLCAMAARNRTKNIYEADVTKGIVILAWVNVFFTLPYFVINGCLFYVDLKYDYYSNDFIENNIRHMTPITLEVKHFIYWMTFFVLLTARHFRIADFVERRHLEEGQKKLTPLRRILFWRNKQQSKENKDEPPVPLAVPLPVMPPAVNESDEDISMFNPTGNE